MSQQFSFDKQNNADQSAAEIPAATGLAVLLIGAAVGLAAGLLMAPKPGRDLRSDLLSRTGNWKNLADVVARGRDKLVDAVESSHRSA